MMTSELAPWERLSTHTLFKHRFFSIIEDIVRLPTGKTMAWWRFGDGLDFVTIIPINERGQVLVSYQYNNAPQCVVAEFAGGGVDEGESYPDAAQRELMEEVGLYARHLVPIGSFLHHNRHTGRRCRVYLATGLEERKLAHDEAEFIATEWVDPATVDQRIADGTYENGIMIAAWALCKLTGMGQTPQVAPPDSPR
jgi:8-oxo-dGTP pyrophosphatase MutT (NUDIX family)